MENALDVLTDDERREVENTPEGAFVDGFKAWARRRTDAPDYTIEAAALMALSLACGDTVVMQNPFGGKPVYMNLYIIIVGPSTLGRKSTVLGYIKGMLPKLAFSGKDYVKTVDDVSTQSFNKGAAFAGQYELPLLMSLDEIAGLFEIVRRQGSYLRGLDKLLMSHYDHSAIHISRTSGDVDVPRGAFVNIFAASTPEPLASVLQSEDVESGLLPRFIIFDARGAQRGTRRSLMARLGETDEWKEQQAELGEVLYHVAKLRADDLPATGEEANVAVDEDDESRQLTFPKSVLGFGPGAVERLDKMDNQLNREAVQDSTGMGAVKGRAFWHIYKLAGLYAVSRDGREADVQLIDVLRAAHTIEETVGDIQKMVNEVGANELGRRITAVEERFAEAPGVDLPEKVFVEELKLNPEEKRTLIAALEDREIAHAIIDERGKRSWRRS